MACADCDNCSMDKQEPLYQIHLTPKNIDWLDFSLTCSRLNIKSVVVENVQYRTVNLGFRDGYYRSDKIYCPIIDMFTSVVVKDYPFTEMMRLSNKLKEQNIEIDRYKLETQVWNVNEDDKYMVNPYIETHFTVKDTGIFSIEKIAKKLGFKVSRNKLHNNKYYLTTRDKIANKKAFLEKVETDKKFLLDLGVEVSKVISEAVIHDSNPAHDKMWYDFKPA